VCVRERERLKESSFDVYPGLDGERKMKKGEREIEKERGEKCLFPTRDAGKLSVS